jgi:hypothetical protein
MKLTHSRLPKPPKAKAKPKTTHRGIGFSSYEHIPSKRAMPTEPDSWEARQAELMAQHDHAIRDATIVHLIDVYEDLQSRNQFDTPAERTWIQQRRAAIIRRLDSAGLLKN